MTVRAVTPRLLAISGHLQFYSDADHHDRENDLRVTGEDIYDPEWPDKPLNLKPTRGSYPRRAGASGAEPSPMHERAGHEVGLDGRSARSPSHTSVGAWGGAGVPDVPSGDGPSGHRHGPRGFVPSPPAASGAGTPSNRGTPSGGNRPGS